MGDIIIKGDSQLPTLILTFVVGFGGILLGALLSSAFELWRRALEGQAASRLIRLETIENRVRADKLLAGAAVTGNYSSSTWKEMRSVIAPFLSELELGRLAESYTKLEDLETLTDEVTARLFVLKQDGTKFYLDWMQKTKDLGKVLRRVEDTAPSRLALGLVKRRRVATIEEIEKEFGLVKNEAFPEAKA